MNTALTTYNDLNIPLSIEEWLHNIRLTGSTRNVTSVDQTTGEEVTQVVSRTEREYRTIMTSFRQYLATWNMDLLSNPIDIARVAGSWASERNETGRKRHEHAPNVSANTYALRLACISSWYAFVQDRYQRPEIANPIKNVPRKKIQPYAAARPVDPEIVESGMDAIDRSTPAGMRDYAILTVALATGKRASELVGMRWKDITIAGRKKHEIVTIDFLGKGEKADRKKLDEDQSAIFLEYLHAQFGNQILIAPGAPVWVSYSRRNDGQAIDTKTLSNICKKYLGTSKVHATRHTFSVEMLHSGANIIQLAAALNHTDIRVTQLYGKELTKEENPFSKKLTASFGFKPKGKA